MNSISGRISNIQRLCTHDGPGLRTIVFFKGCPLRCGWCHNPEALGIGYDIGWNGKKCIACNSCIDVCPQKAISVKDSKITIDRTKCNLCLKCTKECPAEALVCYGKDMGSEELFREISRDKEYFKSSGGGVTLSGGEILIQPEFAEDILRLCRNDGISTAIETSCFGSSEKLMDMLRYTDIAMIDIKIFDNQKHKEIIGAGNALIFKNIMLIKDYISSGNFLKLYIRTPVVNGYTGSAENIFAIGSFIKENLMDVIEKWELILFHNMCAVKYDELGLDWLHSTTPLTNKQQLEELRKTLDLIGIPREKVSISGLAVD